MQFLEHTRCFWSQPFGTLFCPLDAVAQYLDRMALQHQLTDEQKKDRDTYIACVASSALHHFSATDERAGWLTWRHLWQLMHQHKVPDVIPIPFRFATESLKQFTEGIDIHLFPSHLQQTIQPALQLFHQLPKLDRHLALYESEFHHSLMPQLAQLHPTQYATTINHYFDDCRTQVLLLTQALQKLFLELTNDELKVTNRDLQRTIEHMVNQYNQEILWLDSNSSEITYAQKQHGNVVWLYHRTRQHWYPLCLYNVVLPNNKATHEGRLVIQSHPKDQPLVLRPATMARPAAKRSRDTTTDTIDLTGDEPPLKRTCIDLCNH